MRSRLVVVLFLMLVGTVPATAQLEVNGFAGVTVPLRVMIMDTTTGLYYNMTEHRIAGIRVAGTLSRAIALDAQLGVGAGDWESFDGTTSAFFKFPADLWFGDVRLRVRVVGTDAASIEGIAGVGYAKWTTGLFEVLEVAGAGFSFKGVMVGTLGFGFRARVGDRARLTMDLTDRIHAQVLDAALGPEVVQPTQHDLTVTAGVAFPVGRERR
ncbi:MAG: hypothetical protein M3N43_09365 [Actinomycetota bacterium]|nr:hypothetical protein [Actinomycetota bacterium]